MKSILFLALLFWAIRLIVTQDYIEIPALDREADIGHFYDIHQDRVFLLKAIKGRLPIKSAEMLNSARTRLDYKRITSLSDQIDSLQVDASASISLMFGLVKAQGAYGYLYESTENTEFQHAALKYRTDITTEILDLTNKKVLKKLQLDLGMYLGATHIIVGINWGMESIYSIRWKEEASGKATKHTQDFGVEVDGAKYSGEITQSFSNVKESLSSKSGLNFQVYGNIQFETLALKSFDEIENSLKEVPALVKSINGGKGVPLGYIIVSVEFIKSILNMNVQDISINTFNGTATRTVDDEVNLLDLHTVLRETFFHCQKLQQELAITASTMKEISEFVPYNIQRFQSERQKNVTRACGILRIKARHIITATRQNDTKLARSRVEKEFNSLFSNDPTLTDLQQHYQLLLDDYSTMMEYGITIMKTRDTISKMKLQKGTVHFLIYPPMTYGYYRNELYDLIDTMIDLKGKKYFVNCSVMEVRNTTCISYVTSGLSVPKIESFSPLM